MKKVLYIVFATLIFLLVFLTIVIVAMFNLVNPKQYLTTDIADYGQYTGNYDNRSVQEFISSFFPDNIKTSYSDVKYSYRAQKNDTYAFEAYLEFKIEDTDEYDEFITKYTAGKVASEFRYDNTYKEYTFFDEFFPCYPDAQQDGQVDLDIHISYAKIGKIICSPDKQEVIFVALGVYDGGIVTTDFLTVYFDRFQINPLEYAKNVVPA